MNAEQLTFGESMRDGSWRIAGLSLVLGLLFWGWFALTLSPIQRYYFSTYVASSLHRVGSQEPDRAVWILKGKPTNTFEIAEPQDLVPATQGPIPFALSKLALAQGWAGTDLSVVSSYAAGSQQPVLQEHFFSRRSLLDLFVPPLQLLAVYLSVWFSFVYWKRNRDEQRNPNWLYDEPSWPVDAWDFTCDMAGGMKFIAVSGWRWGHHRLVSTKRVRPSGSVSPSVEDATPAPPPVQAELTRAQTLPFRKRQAASEEKWDESKWID